MFYLDMSNSKVHHYLSFNQSQIDNETQDTQTCVLFSERNDLLTYLIKSDETK
jgi:hypothetical protein